VLSCIKDYNSSKGTPTTSNNASTSASKAASTNSNPSSKTYTFTPKPTSFCNYCKKDYPSPNAKC
jgi:hypothetical protein